MNPATSDAIASTADGAHSDERLRRDGRRVEELLEELQQLAPAPVYQRIEELVQRMLGLHGAAIERLLTLVDRTTDDPNESGTLIERLCGDELVASILLLHGLHPASVEDRVRTALDHIRQRSGRRISLVGIDITARVAHLRLGDRADEMASGIIERSILDAAPELTSVTVDNGRDPELVQIDLDRSRTDA